MEQVMVNVRQALQDAQPAWAHARLQAITPAIVVVRMDTVRRNLHSLLGALAAQATSVLLSPESMTAMLQQNALMAVKALKVTSQDVRVSAQIDAAMGSILCHRMESALACLLDGRISNALLHVGQVSRMCRPLSH